MMNIRLPDGSVRAMADGANALDLARSISEGLAKVSVACKVNGIVKGLTETLKENDSVEILKISAPEAKDVLWHTSAHMMAQAVVSLFPDVKVAIGPSIENGFYYDFDTTHAFSPEDFEAIEKKVAEIAAQSLPVVRKEISKKEALDFFGGKGEIYKTELISELPEGAVITTYTQGDFTDLCRGPHLPNTGMVKAFKVLSVAGAYWRGSEKNKMLQRLYAISFADPKELKNYLTVIEEAKKRDHRKIGADMDLFSIQDEIGPGLVLWHPKGALIKHIVETHWREEHLKGGYDLVSTPHVGRSNLWETSGHLSFYKESMYSPMNIDEEDFFMKPMNCPFHIHIYKTKKHSYRELPLRWAELGTVYRYEKSGVLHGLMRVRGFTQDDAHIICMPEQMNYEIRRVLKFCVDLLATFGFKDLKVYISTKPKEKSVGDPARWEAAEAALMEAVKEAGIEYGIDQGGGAFYGPKIDMKIKDAIGREWQCSTIQFDFNLPERFNLTYVDSSGEEKQPYMIHRALLGSIERFMGVLIENYSGDFPLWLAPEQVVILPVSQKFADYAEKVKEALVSESIRARIDLRDEKIGKKIRDAENDKIPVMLVVGERESADNTVSVRRRKIGDAGVLPLEQIVKNIVKEVREKALPETVKS
ncbi:MAG: threonine--tRNA ligase [Fibrobacteres bacterium]|nr:threonine--tRNA ligase [Fibrobacterota bacterium]